MGKIRYGCTNIFSDSNAIKKALHKTKWDATKPSPKMLKIFHDEIYPLVSAVDFETNVASTLTNVWSWIKGEIRGV